VVGELTFRYATSLSMRLQKLLSYSVPQDYYLISTKEFRSNNANAILVAVIDGVMRLDKHKYESSIWSTIRIYSSELNWFFFNDQRKYFDRSIEV
jgi:hypothetical protein